ncbi:MAG TPA: translocation/assembly module TamB domain-containing protein, partial [Xanthomonadaceae bacterium]|nr:translocation/assembly module TamB domain-containing protein [Xanthomonadaceae bacterium]
LVVGRPLSAVRGGEGEMLSDAATALGTAGGDLLARQLGARVGLDMGVEASSELGAALTVGKFLSPRLYLGYGVSLFGTGQAVILRYLISQAWSVEVESGAESKAALNYRLER